MTTIHATQHVFTSVSADKSPTGKRGYQSLCYTPGLTREMLRSIEDHCVFEDGGDSTIKHQFYGLAESLFAISHTVPLKELDEFGRKGRYLAHTLVIDRATLDVLDGCPVDILQQFPFFTDLEPVFAQIPTGSQVMRHVKFDVTVQWRATADKARIGWDSPALMRLASLTWQVQKMKDSGTSTAICADPQAKLSLIALLFALARPGERHLLSFDTWAQGCNWPSSIFFFLQGFEAPERSRLNHWIDPGNKKISDNLVSDDRSPYGQWMAQGLASQSLTGLTQYQSWAATLETCLRTGKAFVQEASNIPEGFIHQFAHINRQAVAQAWLDRLPAGLSNELVARFCGVVETQPTPYLLILLKGDVPAEVDAFLFQQLYALRTVPGRSDRFILEKFIHSARSPGVYSLPAFWNKKEKEWKKSLAALDNGDYGFVVNTLVDWSAPTLPLWQAIVSPHINAWVRFAATRLPVKEWPNALDELALLGDAALDQLAQAVPLLDSEVVKEIRDWLKKSKKSALALRAACPEEPKKKLLGIFKR